MLKNIENAKKRNHWAGCFQSKEVHETRTYVIETITENEMALTDSIEATAAIDAEGFDVRVKLDTETEANVMPKRVYDHLME